MQYCPVCNANIQSFVDSPRGRPNCCCPVCKSLERQRLIWLFFRNRTNLFDGAPRKMLHISPKKGFELGFTGIPGLEYITADLNKPRAMVRMDITNIQYPDNTFDVICCSHVLEHVPDHCKAMRELCRVLTNNGLALIMVPITAPKTFEDLSITDPAKRKKLFGNETMDVLKWTK